MKTTKQHFLTLIILFSGISFIRSMEITDAQKNEYVSLVKKLKTEFPTKDCQTTYIKIKNMVDKCPTREAKEQLLDIPTNKKKESLFHLIIKLSTLLPDDNHTLTENRALQLNIIYQFLNFLPYWLINKQNEYGETPLLMAFGKRRDGTIAWCPEIVFLLLSAGAHPLTPDINKISPMTYLTEILQKRETPDYIPEHPIKEIYKNSIQNILYHYK